jgi:hypothetical protein
MRRIRVTILTVVEQEMLRITSACLYPWLYSMRRIIFSVVCLAVPYFSTFSHKLQNLREKNVVARIMSVLIFPTALKYLSF